MLRTSWVEIPVLDLERAMRFYQSVLGLPASEVYANEVRRVTILPTVSESAGVALNQTANFAPSNQGVLVYFRLDGDLQGALDRVAGAGGAIVAPKQLWEPGGFYAIVQDTEGNLFALNSAE